jgi:soluble lytic murein transglycosylase-like protein
MKDAMTLSLAQTAARKYGLQAALVCAVIEQESSWDATALRMEPLFYLRYVQPLRLPPTESVMRSTSFGLMQILGQVARELGYRDSFDALCDVETNLELGCHHLGNKLDAAGGDVTKGLLLWNGGGNALYPVQVMARIAKYQVTVA